MNLTLKQVMELRDGREEAWVLVPTFAKMIRPADYEGIIKKARVKLVHDHWPSASEDARELSDAGGIEHVALMRVKSVRTTNGSMFRDGRSVARETAA